MNDVSIFVLVRVLAGALGDVVVDVVVYVAADFLVIVAFVDPDVVAVETVRRLADRVKNRVENSMFPQC